MRQRRTFMLVLGLMCLAAPALASAYASQSTPRTSSPSGAIGITGIDPDSLQVELEGQASFVPGDGTPHKTADIKIADNNFIYDFSASAPTLTSPGTFGPAAKCGLGLKQYSVTSTWVSGSDFPSNGPPLTKVGELNVQFPLDAQVGCFGFGAKVSVTFTVIGPDEDD